jgi:hypothetical protein
MFSAASRYLTQQVVGTSFRFYTEEEVRRISVKRVTNPVTFDSFNHATERCVICGGPEHTLESPPSLVHARARFPPPLRPCATLISG